MFKWITKKKKKAAVKPVVILRADHCISRKNINPNALKVLYRLKEAGFAAYLVGGGVRDLLVNFHPKDFDIATDAKPEEIRKLFRNSLLIGRRFRLAHIHFGREVIEVATFRAGAEHESDKHKRSEHGMLLRDNVYGTIEEDALRRDFTINALYYNIKDFSIIDYVGGMADLKSKIIRMIGDPETRYHEDPVRMLRAVRLAAKLNFTIAKETAEPILKFGTLLQNVSTARLFEEANKWFCGGKSLATFELFREFKLFEMLLPQTAASFVGVHHSIAEKFVKLGFASTDKRLSEDKPVNPAFLYAVLLWWPFQAQLKHCQKERSANLFEALSQAMHRVFSEQKEHLLIPNRLRLVVKEIWLLQYRFESCRKGRINWVLNHQKFRAAYDFLLLRAEAGEHVQKYVQQWTKYMGSSLDNRQH